MINNNFNRWFIVFTAILAIFYFWKPSLPLIVGDTNKLEKWMRVEKKQISVIDGLDQAWSASIFRDLKVEAKLREPLTSGTDYDFVFRAEANLTQPVLKTDVPKTKTVDHYEVYLTFTFIDDDGFKIHEISPDLHSNLVNEDFRSSLEWFYEDDDRKFTAAVICRDVIAEPKAKRVAKISCDAMIIASLEDIDAPQDPFSRLVNERAAARKLHSSNLENKKIKQ
jgi:hypothetical protein